MIKIGCAGYPVGQSRYQRRFDFVEIGRKGSAPARAATVDGWRKKAPQTFEFSVYGEGIFERLRATAWSAKRSKRPPGDGIRHILDVGAGLNARLLVFPTPGLAPHADNATRVEAAFLQVPRNERLVFWDAPKNWPESLLERLASRAGVYLTDDAFAAGPAGRQGPVQYIRLPLGGRQRMTERQFETVQRRCTARLAYVVFDHGGHAWDNATRFHAFLGAAREQ